MTLFLMAVSSFSGYSKYLPYPSDIAQGVLSTMMGFALGFVLSLLPAFAQAQPTLGVPSTEASPPALAAKAYLLMDANSGRAIVDQASQERVEPASLTKLMTAYLTFQALKNGQLTLSQTVPISEKAWKAEGSRMFVEPKTPVTVDELLHGMIIQSGNDASIALAEAVAGSEDAFAERMNQQAQRLGMQNSHFMNATGLTQPGHTTTAQDLALLARALIRDFPDQYQRLYSVKTYTYNKITQPNRNRLLWLDPYVDGMKTGHTALAGYCLIASAKRGDMRLLSILLGAPTDNARIMESQKLLNYGFQMYETKRLYQHGQVIKTIKVWKGDRANLNLTVADDSYLTLPRGQFARITAKLSIGQPVYAPVTAGQVLGKLEVSLEGTVLGTYPLVAAEVINTAGIFKRLWDSVRLLFE